MKHSNLIAVLSVLWLVLSGGGNTSASPVTNAGPRLVSVATLDREAASLTAALHWAATNGQTGSIDTPAASPMLVQSLAANGLPTFIPASARLLNVDLAADPSYKTGPAAVGHETNDFWNCYWNPDVTEPTTIPNLLWSDQQASGIDMTVVNAPGGWGNEVADPMFSGYLYACNGQELEVHFSGIPAGTYDLFAYCHGPINRAGNAVRVSVGSSVVGYRGTTIWSPSWSSPNWEEGIQYVRFRQITVGSEDTLSIIVERDADGYALFNGLQLARSDTLSESPPVLYKLLNVDFGGGTGKVGLAAFGQAPTDAWNWFSQFWVPIGELPNLIWADASPSGAGLVVEHAPGYWGFPCSDPMYGNYVYYASEEDPDRMTVTLTNLAPGLYDFCFYAHATAEGDNSIVELWSGATQLDLRETGTWGTHPATTDWQEGQQYVVFRNVTVEAGVPIIARVQPGAFGYAILNGIQVMQLLDRDADGLPDWWELQYFGDLSQGPGDDPDSDNYSNLQEYHLGRNPALGIVGADVSGAVALSVYTPLR